VPIKSDQKPYIVPILKPELGACSQALSRTSVIAGNQTNTRAIDISGIGAWRLVVQASQVIRFNIAQAQSNTTQNVLGQYCPQNGIVTYDGYGDALISVTNLTLIDATVQLDVIEQYPITRQHESESDSNNSNVVFKDVGEFGGWNPPYCSYLCIFSDNPIKLRVINGVDLSVIWQENNITTPTWGTHATMKLSNRDRIQFASETNLTVAKIRAVWTSTGN
jgi:hypothetical protein|tara:strand:+ start:405 stop:1067 length:663 start_codon:yes stop_codon:yes gene_type:complete